MGVMTLSLITSLLSLCVCSSRTPSSLSSSPPCCCGASRPFSPPSSTTLPSLRPTGHGTMPNLVYQCIFLMLSSFIDARLNIVVDSESMWPLLLRSGENRTTMHKCYTFLIFMVLLLPSLGLSRYFIIPGLHWKVRTTDVMMRKYSYPSYPKYSYFLV